jgi:hypothetical protein
MCRLRWRQGSILLDMKSRQVDPDDVERSRSASVSMEQLLSRVDLCFTLSTVNYVAVLSSPDG